MFICTPNHTLLCTTTTTHLRTHCKHTTRTQVIALHDKYLAYVGTCFANSSLFHKALKEAFEGFCNKNVAGSTSAELMANFCDNLLKKVCCVVSTCGCVCKEVGLV